jgi:diadenosine tetraphosphate (Ap4A) HIT family hydrolase
VENVTCHNNDNLSEILVNVGFVYRIQVEKHLIASIGDESYLVLPKGALVPEHVLIVPLAHFSSLAVASQQTVDEIGKYITALKTLFKDKVNLWLSTTNAMQKVIIFERNIKLSKVSTHMHLQVVPIDKEVPDEDCYNVFENDARNVLGDQIEVRRFAPEVDLQSAIIEAGFAESQYLLAEMPDGGKIIHEIPEHFIKQTLAMGRRPCSVLLNAPEREDWRSCALSVDEEKKLTASFKTNFKPLDFTN